jgi:hypothetical protein
MNESLTELTEQELGHVPLSLVDDAGTVFRWHDRVLRGVKEAAAERMQALLDSGLLTDLMERGWIPRCRKADVRIQGFSLVIEQDLLPVVTYPYEWSYGMLRDAAIRVLDINSLARAHGWELKDCHGFNIVFDGPQPLWVDLGSFVPRAKRARGWLAYEQFLRFFEYPLWIWSHGGEFTARRMVAVSEPMSHVDYGLYRWPWMRWAGAGFYQKLMTRWHHEYRHISRVSDDKIRARLPALFGGLVCFMNERGWLPFQEVPERRMRARTLRRRRRGPRGFWSDYQGSNAQFVATGRFRCIIELLRQAGAESVIELGGNQGWLSEQLLRDGVVKSAICTDADEPAVDRAYERTKAATGRLHTAVLDFIFPLAVPYCEPARARLRADAVCALAVTHHLLLTQKIPIRPVLQTIAAHSRRLVFVEFMPLGLWDGRRAPPIPDWYRLDWFREAFVREFDLVHEESLEENRILFCGTLRKPAPGL